MPVFRWLHERQVAVSDPLAMGAENNTDTGKLHGASWIAIRATQSELAEPSVVWKQSSTGFLANDLLAIVFDKLSKGKRGPKLEF